MKSPDPERTSKLLSLVLRHNPGRIGITLDDAGWTDTTGLIAALNRHGHGIDLTLLRSVVANSPKQRFALSADGTRIRANQSHSVAVDLQLPPVAPPEVLWHGTVDKFLPSIRLDGLEKRQRHHVHLSADVATATTVGERRGKPVVLKVKAAEMARDGFIFHRSENSVWLTDRVPSAYLEFPM